MIEIQVIHRTGKKTDVEAETWPKIIDGIYIIVVDKNRYLNIPIDSVEIMSMERKEGGDANDI